jgi:hypothetical protein
MILELCLPNDRNELVDMKTCGINDVAKYLGVPLGTRILSRMKFNNKKSRECVTNVRKN